jgi:hypothetical protein
MSRRRRETAAETETPAAEAPAGEGPQVKVVMSGSADEVADRLKGVATPVPEKPRTTRAEEVAEINEQFLKDLANPTYTVKVKRLRPKEWNGQKANGEVWSSELPLQWEEIKEEVQKTSGGGTYKVAVIDPSTGNMVSAKNFEQDGDPILDQADQKEIERIMMEGGTKDATQTSIEGLDRRAQVTAKMIEVESLEHQLTEAREARNGGQKKHAAPDDTRINDLERRLTESKHQAELEARDRKHQEEMRELKTLITQNAKPQASQGASEITLLITQMQKNQESSDKRFEAMQKQMQDDKMNLMLEEIKALRNKPQQKSDMLEMAEAMLSLKKVFGWGGDDDDDDEADPDDDRPWWQKALDKLGDKITPKVIDKIFAKLDGLETSGKTVSKEDFMKINEEEIAAHARKVADEEIQRIMGQKPAALPPPAPAPAPVPAPTTTTKTELPPAPAPAPAAPASAAAPPPPPSAEMILARKRCELAAGSIAMIEHELTLRQRNYEWNYELWDNLPEDLLDRVCMAPDCILMLDVFKVEGLDVAAVDAMKAKIAADPKALAWLKRGHDELALWKTKADADPTFDPGAEEEPEEEEPQ